MKLETVEVLIKNLFWTISLKGPSVKISNELDNFLNAIKIEKEKCRRFIDNKNNCVKSILPFRTKKEKLD
jgi:hypothetical protein